MSGPVIQIREAVIDHLRKAGFLICDDPSGNGRPTIALNIPAGEEKDFLRRLHEPARRMVLRRHQDWIRQNWGRLSPFFAPGSAIDPERIRPVLVEVVEPWQMDLLRLARLTWSLPYSSGFGRRLRFLIMDEGNRNVYGQPFLIGILVFQSPPLSFPPRDRLFRYPPGRKVELVNQTMDIQTLGALPPYSHLLGGKLVALAAASNEVRETYFRKYRHRPTVIEERFIPPHLVALTTTSAFGRSSLYNRLRYRGEPIAVPIGPTEGYGIFHLEPLYPMLRNFLSSMGIGLRGGFHDGPRVRWQICVRALQKAGLSASILRHMVPREAFLFPLIRNLEDYMEGRSAEPAYRDLPFRDLAEHWRERWLIPRASRVSEWRDWEPRYLLDDLLTPDGKTGLQAGFL